MWVQWLLQVLLLGPGGRTVYLGSPPAALLYFSNFLNFRWACTHAHVHVDHIYTPLQARGCVRQAVERHGA